MEKITVLNKAQEIINKQFDKILKVTLNNNQYRIAIRRDEIPKIKNIGIYENILVISFSDLEPNTDFQDDFIFKENTEGKIEAVFIRNFDKLKNETYRVRLNRKLINFIKELPENDKTTVLIKHKNKRIAHSISEIIKTVPNNWLAQFGHLKFS